MILRTLSIPFDCFVGEDTPSFEPILQIGEGDLATEADYTPSTFLRIHQYFLPMITSQLP